ncbi:MAG: hypothetical protein KGH58_03600 [Candidatus Micrarchaeota archaeon]|nr:hypothetical protein [Candidatus Micrarchaeota archaeon]
MRNLVISIESVIGGVIIALLTVLVNSTPGGLVGATWYGWPESWLIRMVVAPQYNPWNVQWVGLVVDAIVWIVIVAIVMLAANRAMGGKKPSPSRRKR